MTIAIISHHECEQHFAGYNHPECPERVQVIQNALETYPFKTGVEFYQAPLAYKAALIATHGKEYVDWIFSFAPLGDEVRLIDEDTLMNAGTLNAALRAAGAVILAVDLVEADKVKAVFCNVRPPGHHAERERAMGFCFFNNVAVGVKYAMQTYNLKRVAIVDFDVHHGNGTQNIFQEDENVLYCSSFQNPFYPGYERELDNEHLLSVPLDAGTGSDAFREKTAAAWFAKLEDFKPELIFISAGFDAHQDDPLAGLNLQAADYVWLTTEIVKIAKRTSGGKIISVLEGGYNLQVLASCVPLHVAALV